MTSADARPRVAMTVSIDVPVGSFTFIHVSDLRLAVRAAPPESQVSKVTADTARGQRLSPERFLYFESSVVAHAERESIGPDCSQRRAPCARCSHEMVSPANVTDDPESAETKPEVRALTGRGGGDIRATSGRPLTIIHLQRPRDANDEAGAVDVLFHLPRVAD